MSLHPFIDFFAIVGWVVYIGLPVGFIGWHVADKIRHRATDKAELARLLGGER